MTYEKIKKLHDLEDKIKALEDLRKGFRDIGTIDITKPFGITEKTLLLDHFYKVVRDALKMDKDYFWRVFGELNNVITMEINDLDKQIEEL